MNIGIDTGRRDPSGRGTANAGRILGIIGTVFLIIGVVALVFFLIAALALADWTEGVVTGISDNALVVVGAGVGTDGGAVAEDGELVEVDVAGLVADGGPEAMQLRIAEDYVKQFGHLARQGNTLIVPANLSDVSSMIALATKLFKNTPSDNANVTRG